MALREYVRLEVHATHISHVDIHIKGAHDPRAVDHHIVAALTELSAVVPQVRRHGGYRLTQAR